MPVACRIFVPANEQRTTVLVFIGLKMVGVEKQDSLRFIKILVGKDSTCVDLWKNDRGDLFIRLPLQNLQSHLVVPVVDETMITFCMNECTLNDILDLSPTPFAMLQEGDTQKTMYLPDAELTLWHPDFTYSQLKAASTI
jgi:hypothetical protein